MSEKSAIIIFAIAVLLGLSAICVVAWEGCQLVNSGIKLMNKQTEKYTPQCPVAPQRHERMK